MTKLIDLVSYAISLLLLALVSPAWLFIAAGLALLICACAMAWFGRYT